MKEYIVKYRKRGDTRSEVKIDRVSANNACRAKWLVYDKVGYNYVITKVRLIRNCIVEDQNITLDRDELIKIKSQLNTTINMINRLLGE